MVRDLPFALGFAASVSEELRSSKERYSLRFDLGLMGLRVLHDEPYEISPLYFSRRSCSRDFGGWLVCRLRNPEKRFKTALGLIVCAFMIVTVRDLIVEPRSLTISSRTSRPRFSREIRPAFYILPIVIAGGVATVELFTGFGLTRLVAKILLSRCFSEMDCQGR